MSTPLKAKILTVSDGVKYGTREDLSAQSLEAKLESAGWEVVDRQVCEDGESVVAQNLRQLSAGFHGLIVTTGGTGFGPRDLTPEGTLEVVERQATGLAEAMRLVNPLGRLSRGIAGTLGNSLIINTVGSAKGCVEMLEAVLDVLPHAIKLLVDNTDPHPNTGSPHPHTGSPLPHTGSTLPHTGSSHLH